MAADLARDSIVTKAHARFLEQVLVAVNEDTVRPLREEIETLRQAAVRAERKLTAYVGVCTGDKELTETVLPMLRAALSGKEA
jgi:hypothetical protein